MTRAYKYYDLSRIMNAKYMPVKVPLTFYSLIATWFFVGRIPIASGTLGSLAFYPIYYYTLMTSTTSSEVTIFFGLITIILFLLGVWAVTKFQDATNTFDHSYVVIDEVIGMSLTSALAFEWVHPLALQWCTYFNITSRDLAFIFIFLAFRYYDIKKPLFIKIIDRYYKNPFGVIFDDMLAALFASATLYVIYLIYDFIQNI